MNTSASETAGASAGRRSRLQSGIAGRLLLTATVVTVVAWTQGWEASGTSRTSDAESINALPVNVIPIAMTDHYQQPSEFVGTVEAARESELGFELAGLVKEVVVNEGDRVDAGDLIARLDTQQLIARGQVVISQRAAAQATLDELVAGPRKEDIQVQRSEVARLSALAELAKLTSVRTRNLRSRNAVTQQELEDADFALQAAQAAQQAAQAKLNKFLAGTRREKIAAQQAMVAEAEAEGQRIRIDIEKSTLRAPFAGVVGRRFVDDGVVIATGTAVVELFEMSAPEARIGVDAATAATLDIGDSHDLRVGDQLQCGRVRSIRPDVNPRTRTVEVRYRLQPDAQLRSGDLVVLRLNQRIESAGAWLPLSALTESSRGLWSCYVAKPVNDGTQATHRVDRSELELLRTETDRVFVRGMLDAGELVVADGLQRLVAGQRVRVKTTPPEKPQAVRMRDQP